jgi:hypothetical protein
MQSMGMRQWDELSELATSTVPMVKRDFPGGVVVEVVDGEMQLSRTDRRTSP